MGMSYLIDTHILLWWLLDDPKLNANGREIIRNPRHKIFGSPKDVRTSCSGEQKAR
jgi:PIN domain nuclease of toxin-antitoxin system